MDYTYLERGQPVALGLAVRRLEFGRPVRSTEALVPLRREAVKSNTYIAVLPEIFISARFLVIHNCPDVPLALVI